MLFWVGVTLLSLVLLVALFFWAVHLFVVINYLPKVFRIFQEKPLFAIPFGKPDAEAEDIELPGHEGIALRAAYWKARAPRKGVIWFGLEFGSNRWSAGPYCEFLRDAGYDIFAVEFRGQGQTPTVNGYEPLQWVTRYDIDDARSALEYLKGRPDADPRGFGLFGLSKGAAAGLFASAEDADLRCVVTDGMFGTRTTMVPYMEQWVHIYTDRKRLVALLPKWYYAYLANRALRRIERMRRVKYPSLGASLRKLGGRPLLMIHGGRDNYIKPDMARSLFNTAAGPKELWIVPDAKHNQAVHVAAEEYRRRVLSFFDNNLGGAAPVVRERVSA